MGVELEEVVVIRVLKNATLSILFLLGQLFGSYTAYPVNTELGLHLSLAALY
jgi:hypothetical protein